MNFFPKLHKKNIPLKHDTKKRTIQDAGDG
jgi:hypothetical protein